MKRHTLFLISIFLLSLQHLAAQDYESYIQCEDTCRHVHGIDLSHYQGEVFWEVVGANSKMAYVYLKATEGGTHIDETYEKNIELAHRYGLKVGSYHFFRPKTELSKQLDSLFKFLDLVEEAYRQKPLLYTYTNFYNKHLQGKIDDYKLMIAQYSEEKPELADGKDYTMWQYTAKGKINGINTYVDKSRFMGRHSMREIRFKHF